MTPITLEATSATGTAPVDSEAVSALVAPAKKEGFSFSNLFTLATFALLFVPVILHSVLNVSFSPVLTGSMQPHIKPGDLLITKAAPASTVKVGDIVVLRTSDNYALYSHRIVKIDKRGSLLDFTTKGDANPTEDPGVAEVSSYQELPVVRGHLPFMGRAILFLGSSAGRLMGVILLAVSFALAGLRFAGRKVLEKHHNKHTNQDGTQNI